MNLQTFVSDTLDQIFSGISDANQKRNNKLFKLQMNSGDNKATIAFDVALTISKEDSKGGGGNLKVLGIGIGGSVDNTSSSESVSRIKFSIEVDKDGSEKEVGFHNQTKENFDKKQKQAMSQFRN